MRLTSKAAFAALASLAMAGAAMAAEAPRLHLLNVALPDGSVAHIRYAGDTPPRVTVAPAPRRWTPLALSDGFDPAPFAELERLAAAMDRQSAMMLAGLDGWPAAPAALQPDFVAAGALPAGAVGYSLVSTTTANGTCTRAVEITSQGPGRQPKVERRSAGDCNAAGVPTSKGGKGEPGASNGEKPAAPASQSTSI